MLIRKILICVVGAAVLAYCLPSILPTPPKPLVPLVPLVPHKPHLQEKVAKIEVLDFYTKWCLPCRAAAPTIDVLIAQGHKITKIDAEEETELAHKHKVNSYPTFIVLKRGKEVFRTHNVQHLRRYLNNKEWRHRDRDDKATPNLHWYDRIPPNERSINHQIQ